MTETQCYIQYFLNFKLIKMKWIKLNDRLPERGEKVLVYFEAIDNILIGRRMNDSDGKDVWTVFYSDGEKPLLRGSEIITDWMKLPDAPF